MKNFRVYIPLTWLVRLVLKRFGIVFCLLLAVQAQAAVPELCGNGIDDGDSSGTLGACPAGYTDAVYGTGCDLKCPGNDQDTDGYATSEDCDDNNRLVFPGEYYPCDAGGGANTGYRICNVGGSYGSCASNATPLCEATGSGVCKYIDCGSGNNSNAGTYASPYLTFGKVSGGSPGSPPASPYSLAAGDVVYLMGTTDCSTTYSDGSTNVHGYFYNRDGSETYPITIKRYPGATASIVLDTNEAGLKIEGSTDYRLVDLKMSGNGGNLASFISATSSSQRVVFSRLQLNENPGNANNNHACLYVNGTYPATIEHSFLQDCYADAGTNTENVQAVEIINDDVGGGHLVTRNVMWWTRATNSSCSVGDKCGACTRFKHGATEAEAGTNEVSYNYCIWPRVGFQTDTAGLYAHHNLIIAPSGNSTTSPGAFYLDGQDPDSNGNGNARIQYNTVSDGMLFSHRPKFGIGEDVDLSFNVAVDDATSYNSDNGFLKIATYGSDAHETEYSTTPMLTANNNCYHNAATALKINYFQAPSGSGGFGPAGDAGAQYTFAQWQALTPDWDTNSFSEDPVFDSYYRATATNCDDKGWMIEEVTPANGSGSSGFYRMKGRL